MLVRKLSIRQTLCVCAAFSLVTILIYLHFEEQNSEDFDHENGCFCLDSDGVLHDFCYRLPEYEEIHGRRFSCEHVHHAKALGLLDTSHLSFAPKDIIHPVFVTAFSRNHQYEAIYLFETIQKYWPKQRVIVYDLGEVAIPRFQKKWNFLEFRRFNFTHYPHYVRNLKEYRWKPIIIAEALKEFGSIWYMDSSIVFKKGNLSHVYELINCRKYVKQRLPVKSVAVRDLRESLTEIESGWDVEKWKENIAECRKAAYLMHGYTGHGIYVATSKEIYKFIPTNFTEIMKPKAKMYNAGLVFASATIDTIEKILKWYVLCALEEHCMAGNHREHIGCNFVGDRFSEPPRCHRFDQSVVNLLAANAFYYDRHYYVSEIVDFFDIERQQ